MLLVAGRTPSLRAHTTVRTSDPHMRCARTQRHTRAGPGHVLALFQLHRMPRTMHDTRGLWEARGSVLC